MSHYWSNNYILWWIPCGVKGNLPGQQNAQTAERNRSAHLNNSSFSNINSIIFKLQSPKDIEQEDLEFKKKGQWKVSNATV